MITFLKKAWAALKAHWQLVALVVGTIVGYFLFRQSEVSFSDQLKKIQDAHDEEVKQIEAARAEEEREHQQNVQQLQDTLAAVQKQYADQQKELDDKKKAEIEQLVKQYSDDPTELAKRLSDSAGFTVILPS